MAFGKRRTKRKAKRLGNELSEKELTLQQAADVIGVHVNTVRRYIHTGVLPAKIYHARRFKVYEKDVKALMIGQKYAPRKTN